MAGPQLRDCGACFIAVVDDEVDACGEIGELRFAGCGREVDDDALAVARVNLPHQFARQGVSHRRTARRLHAHDLRTEIGQQLPA